MNVTGFPNYNNTLRLQSNSAVIYLPIAFGDEGYIKIKNAYTLPTDTLKIEHWHFYDIRPQDTTYTTFSYYSINKHEMLRRRPRKVKRDYKIRTAIEPPKTISLVINSKVHVVNLNLEKRGLSVAVGHRYDPPDRFDEKGKYKKKVMYIYILETTNTYQWLGEIDLKTH